MALKIFAIVLVLFLAEIVFLTTKDFKDIKSSKKDLEFTDITFENIHSYTITKDGINSNLKASKILKYKNRAVIYDVDADFLHKDEQNNIHANKALLKEDNIHLTGDVHYENNASLDIKSKDLVYNTKTEIATIKSPFILNTQSGAIKGNNLIYDKKNGTIKAKNINYKSTQKE
jgi:LPS export ABC transporter protein LptC